VIPGGLAAAVVFASAAAAQVTPAPVEPGRSAYVGSGDVGRYEVMYGGADPLVSLCVEDTRSCLNLDRPAPEIGAEFLADAPFRIGHEAQVVGAFIPEGFFFWSIDTAPPRDRAGVLGPDRRLEDLVTRPDRHVGRAVTVRSRFRGANLFDDFAADQVKDGWALRDGPFSVWVTGRAPQGEGWKLDVRSAADCVWEVEVEGKVESAGGAVAIAARKVRLLRRDADTSCASRAAR
jgi:hypothetical protein